MPVKLFVDCHAFDQDLRQGITTYLAGLYQAAVRLDAPVKFRNSEIQKGILCNKQKRRENWADIAKGIAILFMVYGHTFHDSFTHFLYFFHMPLFMMVSGYFFSIKQDYRTFCKKKEKALYIPYVTYFFIGFFLNWIYEIVFYAKHPLLPSFFGKITDVVLPLYSTGVTNGIWFLISLLFIFLFWGGIARLCNIYILLFLVTGCSFCSFYLRTYLTLPFFLSPTLVLTFYFFFGYWLKMHSYSPEKIPLKWNILIFLLSSGIITVACFVVSRIDYYDMRFPLPYIPLIFLGITGSMMIFSLSAILLSQFPALAVLLQNAGKCTLWILGMHSSMLRYNHLFWNKISLHIPFLQNSPFLLTLSIYVTTLVMLFGIVFLAEKLLKKYGQEKYLSYLGIR